MVGAHAAGAAAGAQEPGIAEQLGAGAQHAAAGWQQRERQRHQEQPPTIRHTTSPLAEPFYACSQTLREQLQKLTDAP
jgi:hypothetical protein